MLESDRRDTRLPHSALTGLALSRLHCANFKPAARLTPRRSSNIIVGTMLIVRDAATDYANRDYLSVVEVAAYAGLPVREIHRRVKAGELEAFKSAGGQYRFRLRDVTSLRARPLPVSRPAA